MSRTNEIRHMKQYETCKCICRLDAVLCNNKQRLNNDKCRCECKELIDNGVCDKGYAQNPSICEDECDKACDVGEYLDYKNCKCRKRLVNKLADKCDENIDKVKLVKNENSYKCSSCTVYTVLFWIFLTINVGGIGAYFVYFYLYLKKMFTRVGFNTRTQTDIY